MAALPLITSTVTAPALMESAVELITGRKMYAPDAWVDH
jgi:hypothetical protein